MLLVSNDEFLSKSENIDDKTGERVNIPTVIIKNTDGALIKKSLQNQNDSQKVSLAVKYTNINKDGNLVMELYMRSDDVKALHFFKEFKSNFDKMKNKMKFIPVYKYHKCSSCESKNDLKELYQDACVYNGKYCGSYNFDLNIENTRTILLENLRQACVYKLNNSQDDIQIYWNYMIAFSDMCVNINEPLFNEKCAENALDISKANKEKVNACMKEAVEGNKSENFQQDIQKFQDNKVHKYTTIILNGVNYKDPGILNTFTTVFAMYS
jgi:hypothetical protein